MDLLTEKLVDLEQRRITRLLVEMPPRHGKSNLCSQYFPAWYLGRHPDHNVILASYEAGFAQFWGERARDALAEYGPQVFGVGVHSKRNKASDWRVGGHIGRMRCTGVQGGITGRGADLLIVDDPIKDAIEANSETIRNRIWDWWTTTARTRLEPNAIVIIIQTRWHQEDLIGRLRQSAEAGGEQWDSVTLPAIAGADDPLGRQPGDALWPKRYGLKALADIQSTIPAHWWNALFQQRPTPPGGSLAKTVWFKPISVLPPGVLKCCRFWDCAGSERKPGTKPDWTVGAKIGRDRDGNFYILDIVRVQSTYADVDALIRNTAMMDGPECVVREEQEPGSAGLAVVQMRKKNLIGFNYRPLTKRTNKVLGWQPMLTAAEVGKVFMMVGDWNAKYLAEVADAPYGSNDDQLDAVSGGFSALWSTSTIPASDILAIGSAEHELRTTVSRKVF